ncbi:carboxypeptidase M32 [Cucumibacter marinus]|uniref:carboxypeptidase M32 n=1 Tax=Cucumibacter marinus TaxID=1121252 RepID=UPI0004188AD6|nr:carboxypeptidase M32 [Cucumibacter marinus]
MSWQKLDELGHGLEALSHAQNFLSIDEAVSMPAGGGEKRAEAVAAVAAIIHERMTAPQVGDWLEAAKQEGLEGDKARAIEEFERVYVSQTCLPADFVRRKTLATMRGEQTWRKCRAENDWNGFLPALEEIVKVAREESQLRAEATGFAPYDALLEQFDPGARTATIDPVFDRLKGFLKDFVPEVLEAQEARHARRPLRPVEGPFPIAAQRELGLAMMKVLGFDFEHGRLDVSYHPFCGGVPTDIRITTRYREDDFLTALMGTMHETGHALYEQGLPAEWSHWPLGHARGMAVHESQSLFVEKQIGRNPAFWEFALPEVKKHLPMLDDWSIEDVLDHILLVKPGFIRVDADEVTYPLHIILRYEIEQLLIAGEMQAADLPEAWDARMRDYLGLSTLDNPKDGPMQDVHWPGGAFAYFPSYTLGAIMASQQWAAINSEMPDIEDDLRRGDVTRLNDWRRDHIWSKASRLSTPDLMQAATGSPLDAEVFIDHLKARYLR